VVDAATTRRRRRLLARVGVPLGACLLLLAGLSLEARAAPPSLVGRPAPTFALAQLNHPDMTFGPQDMRGSVWLLNVWASWCAPCRREHPLLLDLAGRGIVPIVGLNYMDTRPAGAQWLAQHGDPYRLSILDTSGKAGIGYGIYGVPETFVIDKAGVVRLRLTGPVTTEVIDKTLLPLIKALNRD
jgi:cytochrome c biogenesis protein CcmG/thiol:disulfide interchange protein DsbE